MQYPPYIDIEPCFDRFVASLGGNKIDDLLDKSVPLPKNADYVFASPELIVELKCFEKDLFNVEEDLERWQKHISNWEQRELLTGSDLIQFLFGGKPLPQECYRDLLSACRRTVEEALRKAKAQIKSSREVLGLPNAQALILLANDGNYFLQHGDMLALISNLMMTNFADAAISGFVYFTVNMPASLPGEERELLCWLPAYGDKASNELVQFVDRMGAEWWPFYQRHIGQEDHSSTKISAGSKEAEQVLRSLRHIKR